jgi:hypothetical protein
MNKKIYSNTCSLYLILNKELQGSNLAYSKRLKNTRKKKTCTT